MKQLTLMPNGMPMIIKKLNLTIVLAFFLLLSFNSFSANINLDSALANYKNDSAKVYFLKNYVVNENIPYPDKIKFIKKALVKIPESKYNYTLYIEIAYNYYKLTNDSLAQLYLDSAYQLSLKEAYDEGVADVYLAKGNFKLYKNDYYEALNWYTKAEKLYNLINDTSQLVSIYNNKAIVFLKTGDTEKAIDYFKKSEKLLTTLKKYKLLTYLYINIGNLYKRIKKYDEAKEYYVKGINLQKIIGDSIGLSKSFNNMGSLLYEENNHLEAINYYNKSLELKQQYKDSMGLVYTYSALADVYFSLKSYDKVILYAQKAIKLAKKIEMLENLLNEYYLLKNVYKIQGDSSKTQYYRNLYNNCKIKIDNLQKDKITHSNKQESALQENTEENKLIEKNNQNSVSHIIYILLGIFGLIAIIGLFLNRKR